MKPKFHLFFIVLLMSGYVYGQGLGFSFGTSASKFTYQPYSNNEDFGYIFKSSWGVDVQLNYDFEIFQNFMISTGVEFIQKGNKYEEYWNDGEHTDLDRIKIRINYLQIPLQIKYRLVVNKDFNFIIRGGGFFSMALSGKYIYEYYFDDELDEIGEGNLVFGTYPKADFIGMDTGITVGMSFIFHHFEFGYSYQRGLLNISNNADIYDGIVFTNAHSIFFGYRFK